VQAPARPRFARGGLPAGRFFEALQARLHALLPAGPWSFRARRGHGLLKLDCGHPETHFEGWHHRSLGRFEVGLHFEGSAELNQAATGFFRGRILEVKSALPRAELEPWDRGWSRLYETFPAPALDQSVLEEAAARLAAYVVHLQPLVDAFWKEGQP